MKSRQLRVLLRASVLLAGTLGALGAGAVEVVQTLGQVKTFGSGVIADLDFNTETGETSLVNANAGPVVACKLTAGGAFYCLQGQTIIEWANGPQAAASRDLFSCNDQPKLGITSCTGLTVDDSGVLWLAGKNKQKSHSLVRVEKSGESAAAGACPGSTFASTHPNDSGNFDCFEAKTRYTGRPLLVDVDVVTDADGNFEGIVGLEQRRTAVFYAAGNANSAVNSPEAVTIGTGRDWYLRNKEDLLSLTILDPEDIEGRYALVTTSLGRVLAKRFLTNATSSEASNEVYPNDPAIKGTGCSDPSGTVGYAVRTSTQSDVVFLSDLGCSEVMALKPTEIDDAPGKFELVRAEGQVWDGTTNPDGTGNFDSFLIPILSTEVTYEVCDSAIPAVCEDVTVAATDGLATGIGLGFNLGECDAAAQPDGKAPATACQPVAGFSLWDVKNVDAGVTLYKIEKIPDCRYVPDVCRTLLGLASDANLTSKHLEDGLPIYDPEEVGHPSAQFLVVNSLLPDRVTSQFEGLPFLLMSPYFRAQDHDDEDKYLFQAFAFKAEPGLSISGTFEAEFNVAQLAERENGCETVRNPQLADLLDWDTVTRASEVHPNVLRLGAYPEDAGYLDQYVDVLLNTGCGSSRVSSFGKSFFFYNTEPTPSTFIPSRVDDPATADVDERVIVNNDAVFARMVGRLHDDLGQVLNDYACLESDESDSPLTATDCTALIGAWEDADRQLQRCLDATYQPKASASNQNCQSFVTQFGFFKRALSSVLPNGDNDVANRFGELLVRVRVFEEVYYTRFVPSIPVGGFCAETGPC